MSHPSLLLPVDSLSAALPFFEQALGTGPRIRDGERYAVFATAGTSVALVAGEERIVRGPALSLRVADVDQAVDRLRKAGAQVLLPAHDGPHERRAVLTAPGGAELVLSARLTPHGAAA